MNIGFDASRAFINQKTGTENYSYQILSNLLKIDKRNYYYVYLRCHTKQVKSILRVNETAAYINIPFPRLWTQIGLAARTFMDPLDILFIPSHTLPIIKKPGLKTVITVHDLGSEYLPKMHQLKQRLYLKFMTYFQLQSATHIIAVSQATKEDLVKQVGVNPKNITVIYEGYNKDLFKPNPIVKQLKILKEYDLKSGEYFLFVGTIQPRKNLIRLIQAFANYSKISSTHNKLVLIGKKGWLSEDIYLLPKKLGISDRIRFLGYVPNQHLPSFYSAASALLLPSLFEGFGLPILEAMACGCPVITSKVSSMPEVTGKAAILVDPYSIDSITKGIIEISQHKLREKLVKMGFLQVKRFSWEKATQETLTVFRSV